MTLYSTLKLVKDTIIVAIACFTLGACLNTAPKINHIDPSQRMNQYGQAQAQTHPHLINL
jgi:hypothetical protein